jgi:NAD(P)-dependent dehydrogenase (short-subunit alcohol dehydrogenase family)
MVANAGIACGESILNSKLGGRGLSRDRSANEDEGTIENFDRLMAVNARGTMLCYKHAGKQMVAQGRGGRIIGAFSTLPILVIGTDENLRRLFTGRQTGSSLPFALCDDDTYLARTGQGIDSSYCASKFAIRGLTQAAGTPLTLHSAHQADGGRS